MSIGSFKEEWVLRMRLRMRVVVGFLDAEKARARAEAQRGARASAFPRLQASLRVGARRGASVKGGPVEASRLGRLTLCVNRDVGSKATFELKLLISFMGFCEQKNLVSLPETRFKWPT